MFSTFLSSVHSFVGFVRLLPTCERHILKKMEKMNRFQYKLL